MEHLAIAAPFATTGAILIGAFVTYWMNASRARVLASQERQELRERLARIETRMDGVDARLKRMESWMFDRGSHRGAST